MSVFRLALLASALPLAPALAQSLPAPPLVAPAGTEAEAATRLKQPVAPPDTAVDSGNAPLAADEVGFTAANLEYDSDANVVTASGDVRMVRNGDRLRADKVVWNRATGVVHATGNVVTTNPGGDTAYGDTVELTDSLKDGVVDNLLLVLADGGRLAAAHGRRVAGVATLDHAAYTPCPVTCDDGVTPKEPIWKITAVQVVDDPQRHRIYYHDARLHLLGVPILWLPSFSHPDGSGSGSSGLLLPNLNYNHVNGFEVALPYYWQMAPNRDLTITPHVYTNVLPMAQAQYRQLGSAGAFQVTGYLTDSRRTSPSVLDPNPDSDDAVRAYLDADGQFQLGPRWTITGSARIVTDKTFLRRYDISSDDRLRNVLKAERIDDDSYLSIAGWVFQSLRVGEKQARSPIALPALDYRRRIADPLLGGVFQLEANSLAITRTGGQDTQRAFAGARWDLTRLTPFGQQVTFTAYSRADVYHTADTERTATAIYRGDAGWTGRAIGALAADLRWPFVGAFLGGTQRITPRVQIVGSPRTRNLAIPNEDARAIDLEDSNLFALNRFPGYDRWEDGARVTYGLEYALDLPRFSLSSLIGQSYRFSKQSDIFPDGTGLTNQTSDFVGRATIKYGRLVSLVERFRVDRGSLRVRRNEVDATIGSDQTYVTAGYLKLNRDISPSIEDLRDREELRVGGRVQFLRHWSLFGSSTIDLTSRGEDPTSTADGFDPVRHRIGIDYSDACFDFGVTWRRDYLALGDAREGNTFQLTLAFKNLGR